MDLRSRKLLASDTTETELTQETLDALLEKALDQNPILPDKILLAEHDPALSFLKVFATKLDVKVETAPSICFEELTKEVKQHFGIESYQDKTIPDSYDLCSCASGLKYKFCCKRILVEITSAMAAVEEGCFTEALEWIAKARKIAGNTSEVLCRESIVYSLLNPVKSDELLKKCMEVNPKHPRAYYLHAINLTEKGDLEGAIKAYETAISNYPKTDHYHLNEAHNNLGFIYYHMGNYQKAKSEWELAVKLLPSDETARRNLQDLNNKL